jgi:hypothetical protein
LEANAINLTDKDFTTLPRLCDSLVSHRLQRNIENSILRWTWKKQKQQ